MTNRDYYIALNMVNGLGSIAACRLLKEFKDIKNIFNADIKLLQAAGRINEKTARQIREISKSRVFEAERRQIEKDKIRILTIEDQEYPVLLKKIYDPPLVLYVKGSISFFKQKMVAVIGCRRASTQGLKQANKIAAELAQKGVCIVSGMARGIDTQAHKGALAAAGMTLAVLGSGLNNVYPPENKGLFEKIAQSGAVISEFSLNEKPLAANFPRRNRIISGLSQAVVVIEAAQKSGSLITAGLALDQGREVFAMPGEANSFNARGTNKLIKDGARLIENARDVIDGLEVIWDFDRE